MGYFDNLGGVDEASILAAINAVRGPQGMQEPATGQLINSNSAFDRFEGRVGQTQADSDAVAEGTTSLTPSNPGVPGAAPMVPVTSPYAANAPVEPNNALRPEVGMPTRAPGTPAAQPQLNPLQQSEAEQQQAMVAAAQAGQDENVAGLQAQGAAIDRQVGALGEVDQARQKIDQDYQTAREQSRQKAASETAGWLVDMEKLAKQEPNHQRYWTNTDAFGKSLWLLGMAFSSAALLGEKNAGQQKNPVLDMLQKEIHDDIENQRYSLSRQRDVLKTKGDILQKNQSEKMADLKDDHSMMYQRLEGLKQAAMLKAQAPGPEDLKLAYAKSATALTSMQMHVAQVKQQQSFQTYERKDTEKFQANQNALQRSASYAQAVAVARIAEQGKLEAAKAKGENDKDLRILPRQTGFRYVDEKTGKDVQEIGLNKDQYEKVSAAAEGVNTAAVGLKKFRTALEGRTTSGWLMNNDADLRSAFEEVAGPIGKMLNGGRGPLTDADVQRGKVYLAGVNPDSFIDKLKGPSREKILELVDKRITDLPAQAELAVTTHLGTSVPRGMKLKYTFDEGLVSETPTPPSTENSLARSGVTIERPHPATVDEYERKSAAEAASGRKDSVLPPLPTPLETSVNEFKQKTTGVSVKSVDAVADRASKAIDKWEEANKNQAGSKEAAQDARIRLSTARVEQAKVAHAQLYGPDGVINHVSQRTAGTSGQSDQDVAKIVNEEVRRAGLTAMTGPEIADLVDEINRRKVATKAYLKTDEGASDVSRAAIDYHRD